MNEQTDSRDSSESLLALAAETSPEINVPVLNPTETALLAYSYWEARSGEGGSADEDWFRAETELRRRAAALEDSALEPLKTMAAGA